MVLSVWSFTATSFCGFLLYVRRPFLGQHASAFNCLKTGCFCLDDCEFDSVG